MMGRRKMLNMYMDWFCMLWTGSTEQRRGMTRKLRKGSRLLSYLQLHGFYQTSGMMLYYGDSHIFTLWRLNSQDLKLLLEFPVPFFVHAAQKHWLANNILGPAFCIQVCLQFTW